MMRVRASRPGRIRSALLAWIGKPFGLTDADAWAALSGAGTVGGVQVNAQTMLTISAVWACARLISETISTLPLSMYERASGGKRIATQHPLHFVIHDQPNADTTAAVHWEAMIAAMLLRGNARCEKLMVGPRVVGLQFLDPRRLWIGCGSDGKKEYRDRKSVV